MAQSSKSILNRADEIDDLLNAVQSLIIPFIKSADHDAHSKDANNESNLHDDTRLIELHSPEELVTLMNLNLPDHGAGKEGLLATVQHLLKFSVNTWSQGFLDKLYAGPNAPGIIAELLLAILNTNVHIFQVAPALTVIEKTTAKTFAGLFGFTGPRSGGISTQGGSASNLTSLIIAKCFLYPETKQLGNKDYRFVAFTSAHGHYSLEKAAQIAGIGTDMIMPVPVDSRGRMIPSELEASVVLAKAQGLTPFYVNATAGTTVLGSFDPFEAISKICKAHNLWMHVDASWGGSAIFSSKQKQKLNGAELADSLAVNPHKMMGVPVTCSFLLTPDLAQFHEANSMPAGYLFHEDPSGKDDVWDLADLTLQCGRRGDSLKLALSWIYYGSSGFESQIDHAFSMAQYLAEIVSEHPNFLLISTLPPPCLQICFYFTKGGKLAGLDEENTRITREMAKKLITMGFMIDFAPGDKGSFFRVVVNRETRPETVNRLIQALEIAGREI